MGYRMSWSVQLYDEADANRSVVYTGYGATPEAALEGLRANVQESATEATTKAADTLAQLGRVQAHLDARQPQ